MTETNPTAVPPPAIDSWAAIEAAVLLVIANDLVDEDVPRAAVDLVSIAERIKRLAAAVPDTGQAGEPWPGCPCGCTEDAALASEELADTGQARADHLAAGIQKFADDCKLLLESGGLDNRVARSIAQQERNLRALLAEPAGDTVQAPDVAARVAALADRKAANAERLFADWEKATDEKARITLFAKAGSERYHAEQLRALLGTDTTPEAGRG